MKATFERVDLSEQEISEALTQAKAAVPLAVFEKIETIVRAYFTVVKVLQQKDIRLTRLRRMLFGPTSESSQQVLPHTTRPANSNKPKALRKPLPGHGRNGEADYPTATIKTIPHHRLEPGDRCPGCHQGKVYDQQDRPGILVRLIGQPPLSATVYHLQKLRCNLCGDIFKARPPEGVGHRKYDESSASMIALFKYGGGFPWNRLGKLQNCLGIPVPPSTQWEIVREAAGALEPVFDELRHQAAQGQVLHNDDTAMKILGRMGKRKAASLENQARATTDGRVSDIPQAERTGIFTSGIVSTSKGCRIALFFTGVKHAGENLHALLTRREPTRRPPIQMCDALSRNLPKGLKTILANCLAHGRRQFVELLNNFPGECAAILRLLARVYQNDAIARKHKLSDVERLRFHQERSRPQMDKLYAWMRAQIANKKVEPNSSLGEAINYMLKHWKPLTLFLRKAGAPLDNNICERALKKAILHRKNSLFYKTDGGARVGDLYMSLIHTCDLNGIDPFDYLTQLQRHARQVRSHPEQWMPWCYRRALKRLPPGRAGPPLN